MEPDPQSQPRARRSLAIVAVVLAAFAVAVPASASLSGGDGTSGADSGAVQSAPIQESDPERDRHDCPFERGGDGGDASGSQQQEDTSLPL